MADSPAGASGWCGCRFHTGSECFQILYYRQTFVFSQLVPKHVSGVRLARASRVVYPALLGAGQFWVGPALQDFHFPAEPDRVILLLAGAVGAGEYLWPGLRVEDVIDRRRRAV